MERDRSSASLELMEEKREETSFFLERLAGSAGNLFVLRCYFSAFASAAMSVLYALESARKMIDFGFDVWYQPRPLRLVEEDPITSYVLARRGEAVHVCETRVRSGRMSQGGNREPSYKHFFSAPANTPTVRSAASWTRSLRLFLVSAPTTSWMRRRWRRKD
jgi:hypothetical protein